MKPVKTNFPEAISRAFVIRSEPTTVRYQGHHKCAGYQYPAAVLWEAHLYIAYSINKEDICIARVAHS